MVPAALQRPNGSIKPVNFTLMWPYHVSCCAPPHPLHTPPHNVPLAVGTHPSSACANSSLSHHHPNTAPVKTPATATLDVPLSCVARRGGCAVCCGGRGVPPSLPLRPCTLAPPPLPPTVHWQVGLRAKLAIQRQISSEPSFSQVPPPCTHLHPPPPPLARACWGAHPSCPPTTHLCRTCS